MRITQRSVLERYLNSLNVLRRDLAKHQETLSTGRRLNRPADDPVGLPTLLKLRQSSSEVQQYRQNVAHAQNWLGATESAVAEAQNVVGRLRDLLLSGANESLDQSGRDALHSEWKVLREELYNLANTQHSGHYLFAGSQTDTRPFDPANATSYQGDSLALRHEVNENTLVKVNLDGQQTFSDLLQLVEQLGPALQSGATELGGTLLARVDQQIDGLLGAQAHLGARANQIYHAEEMLDDREVALEALTSQLEDADLARVIIQLREAEAAYEAALQTGARLVQRTLLDYLD